MNAMQMNETENAIKEIVEAELREMSKNVLAKHQANQRHRENNPFHCFEDPAINRYMGMGRSFDLQLGGRLQKIAFQIAGLHKDWTVPNDLVLRLTEDSIYMRFEKNKTVKQNVLLMRGGSVNENDRRVKIEPEQVRFYESLSKIYKETNGKLKIPVDLFYFNADKSRFEAFEIKAGGNLDTKNADANYKEVMRLQKIFSPLADGTSYFATCYNNMGEGAEPQGSIFRQLPQDQTLVGSAFWQKILPSEITYERWIEIYQYVFREVVNVEQQLQA